MDAREVTRYWERNAPTWTRLARAGYDVYRDTLNTPAFFAFLPDVAGKRGLDIGCGEGHNTRLLAARGAAVVGIDVTPTFIHEAVALERARGGSIGYLHADAHALPFGDARFDFATAFMSLMDIPDHERALREAGRVLRPGGFLQFSITHPCFSPPHRRLLRDAQGLAYAVEVGRYFDRDHGRIERWTFSAAPPEVRAGLEKFEIPVFHRTLADWFNTIRAAGFVLDEIREPSASDATVRRTPHVQDTQVAAYFLHVRCVKPA